MLNLTKRERELLASWIDDATQNGVLKCTHPEQPTVMPDLLKKLGLQKELLSYGNPLGNIK